VLDPDGSNATVSFTPTVAGTYEFSLVVNDGGRDSVAVESTVNIFNVDADLVHRLEGYIGDIEFSKALNALVYLSSADGDLHIMNVADFSETTVALPYSAYRVGISPDGLFAAVSHAGMASLVDLTLGTAIDSQTYPADWGDIVLDSNQRAHLVPVRDQWVDFVSLDFANDLVSEVGAARANTQLRMHPLSDWVYGADRGLSPSDFEKWDVSLFPSTSLGDSPYHGDFSISGNIWISETGDQLLVAGANRFLASADPMLDMTHTGVIADDIVIEWADHSAERGEWVVATSGQSGLALKHLLIYYEDVLLAQQKSVGVEAIPTDAAPISSTPRYVFFNDDGTQVIAIIEAISGLANDPFAVQISTP
jgi:hypothetical protein